MSSDATALQVVTDGGALSTAIEAATKRYRAQARSPRTREAYSAAWERFAAWCSREGRQPLPASFETVAGWIAALADGQDGPPRSASTINQYLSAVIHIHRAAGHSLDRKHPLISETWAGISRTKAKTRPRRQVRPLMADDVRSLLEAMRWKLPADCRDAALLGLGWAGALRRSELVGLDWLQRGDGDGSVHIEDGQGLVVTLATSKGSQHRAVTVEIPRSDAPLACEAVGRWAKAAGLKAGEPLFCSIDKGQRLVAGRLTARSVARIVKARVRALAQARGKTREEADELVQQFSGHSMRAGYATEAGSKDLPSYRIMQHTRHRSHEQVASYIREGQKWFKSGLKGVGF